MILLTGDIHRLTDYKRLTNIKDKNMTREDYVIVLGDFGFPWNNSEKEKEAFQEICNKRFTVLFVDGNHENHDLLDRMEVETWNGGKIHRLSDNVIHLMRGQIFNLNGIKIFTFGGADSIDKHFRVPYVTWWPRELPSGDEYEEGLCNLEKEQNEVDYILTHTCPKYIKNEIGFEDKYKVDIEEYLDLIAQRVKFRRWYFGHLHDDFPIGNKYVLVYKKIIKIT